MWQGRKILMTVIPPSPPGASLGNWKEQPGLCTDFSETHATLGSVGAVDQEDGIPEKRFRPCGHHRPGIRIILPVPSHP